MAEKRIGFVDYHLDNFHANTYLDAFRGPLAERGWSVAGVTALDRETGVDWAAKKRVPYLDSVDSLATEVDAFAILAPSNPETHAGLCEQVLPHGKPTFVDKTFAPDAATAERIFALADRCGTPIQSTSALRTTNIQAEVARLDQPLVNLAQWAGGASFAEYGVHPVELAVSCLGPEVQRLVMAGAGDRSTLLIEFSRGRTATIDFHAGQYVPFFAVLTTEAGSRPIAVDDSVLFVDAAAAMLDFFDAGRPLVPREETMAIMRILDAARDPEARHRWIDL